MYLYGASGHGKVIKDIVEAQGDSVEAFIDDNPNLSEKDKNLWHQTLIKRLTRDLGFYLKELESYDDRKYYSEQAVVNFPELETVFSNSTKEPTS